MSTGGLLVNGLIATAPGVMPGTDLVRSTELLESELGPPHLPTLPQLPSRGHHASAHGRAIALLTEMYAELVSYGWRLTSRPGSDHHRAAQLLKADVDTLADIRGARAESGSQETSPGLKIDLLGPVSFSAQLALPSGEKVLIDHGGRRDLAQSLALGAAAHVEHVRRSCAPASLTVVVHESDYDRVRSGAVPTVSGYRTIRAMTRDETRTMLNPLLDSLRTAGADDVFLDFGGLPELAQVEDHGAAVDGFSLPLHRQGSGDWERVAELVEGGTRFLTALLSPGEAPGSASRRTGESSRSLPEVTKLAARLTEPWGALGMPLPALEAMTLLPMIGCERHGFENATETDVMRTLTRVRDTADALRDQIRAA